MTTATKTASHYVVFCYSGIGTDALDLKMHDADTIQDALEYRDIHGLTDAEVWVAFTDGTSEQVA